MIETLGLSKTYRVPGKGRKAAAADVVAVAGIDLHVAAGQIFGLLGPNGAGKSTTIKMLATLVEPSGGSATVAGFDLMRDPNEIRRRIGLVSQNGGMDSEETARRELIYQGMIFGADRKTAEGRAQELLERFELTSAADRKIKTLSGGQRRRVDIASGLVHKPALLFLDEPTTGLDPQSRANLWDEIRTLRNEGSTVVITTHYLDEADALCDRLAIVDHGKIVAEGTADQLKAGVGGDVVTIRVPMIDLAEKTLNSTMLSTGMASAMERFGDDTLRLTVPRSDTAVGPILKSLDDAGVEMAGLTTARPSLDDVFLRHTGRSLRDAAA
jgi:ABC-2 type transport system ATP-binding protein